MNAFATFLNAYADELGKLADGLNNLRTDLVWLRDEMSDAIRDDRQLTLARQLRVNRVRDNLP